MPPDKLKVYPSPKTGRVPCPAVVDCKDGCNNSYHPYMQTFWNVTLPLYQEIRVNPPTLQSGLVCVMI